MAGAGASSSFTFDHLLVTSPVSPAGNSAACGGNAVTQLGFWSVLGTPYTPTYLALDRSAQDRSAVDLSWTGSATTFQVYRGDAPEGVLDPGNLLAETSSCAESDPGRPGSEMLFYLVLPRP